MIIAVIRIICYSISMTVTGFEQEPYLETPEEVLEIYESARRYILEGDSFDEPYDLRGLGVYGVIRTLREVYEETVDGTLSLSESQEGRYSEVEVTVDRAVAKDKQFYPFGKRDDKTELDGHDFAQLSDRKTHSAVAPLSSLDRRNYRKSQTGGINGSGEKSSPVTIKVSTLKVE